MSLFLRGQRRRRRRRQKQKQRIDSLRWFSQRRSRTPHFIFWGYEYDPQIRTPRSYLPLKFHHPVFTRSEVIVLTNPQTNPHTNKQIPMKASNVLRYATTLGNKDKDERNLLKCTVNGRICTQIKCEQQKITSTYLLGRPTYYVGGLIFYSCFFFLLSSFFFFFAT